MTKITVNVQNSTELKLLWLTMLAEMQGYSKQMTICIKIKMSGYSIQLVFFLIHWFIFYSGTTDVHFAFNSIDLQLKHDFDLKN